jgi:N-acetylneuraminic acid mutarotase
VATRRGVGREVSGLFAGAGLVRVVHSAYVMTLRSFARGLGLAVLVTACGIELPDVGFDPLADAPDPAEVAAAIEAARTDRPADDPTAGAPLSTLPLGGAIRVSIGRNPCTSGDPASGCNTIVLELRPRAGAASLPTSLEIDAQRLSGGVLPAVFLYDGPESALTLVAPTRSVATPSQLDLDYTLAASSEVHYVTVGPRRRGLGTGEIELTTTCVSDADCDGVPTTQDCNDADASVGDLARSGQEAPATWVPARSMVHSRYLHSATLLADGRVLVAGGHGSSGLLASAELYDPTTNTWSSAGSMASTRYIHSATLLANGRVLVAGGLGSSPTLTSAELYDPATNTWSRAGSMVSTHLRHTATLLADGRVLVVGGEESNTGPYLATAELYDPTTNTWSSTRSMATARERHTATRLAGGRVLVAGGFGWSGQLASAELYDPTTNTWSSAASMTTARGEHTETLFSDGRVLVAGGGPTYETRGHVRYPTSEPLASAEVYDPVINRWSPAGSMSTVRFTHAATRLTDGRVLLAGGQGRASILASAEIFDPATNAWSSVGSMAAARYWHTTTVLTSGQVLVAGGPSAELFVPGSRRCPPAAGL